VPEELECEVVLQPQVDIAVVVERLLVDGLRIVNWTQQCDPKSTLLTLRLRPITREAKITGTCHVELKSPPGEKIAIPICLIRLKQRAVVQ
jgi:hypothetical protein